MKYIENSFARMDLRKIRQFLLYGTDEFGSEKMPYRDRLKIE